MLNTVEVTGRSGMAVMRKANSIGVTPNSDIKLYYETEPGKLFNYDAFLQCYQSGSPSDLESWSFLRYFTSMPLFKRLVERQVLEKDQKDLEVFYTRSYACF